MLAVDTNVFVRLLVADEPRQYAEACALFAAGPIWLAKTVLLETAWVLGSVYGFDPPAVCSALRATINLENVLVEDRTSVLAALDLADHGMELADALHISSRPRGSAFVSFDKAFVKRAVRAGLADVRSGSTK